MKTFEAILDEVAKENGHEDVGWVFTRPYRNSHEMVKEAAKRYATQVAQDALNRAAENAESFGVYQSDEDRVVYPGVNKESITNTQIILP